MDIKVVAVAGVGVDGRRDLGVKIFREIESRAHLPRQQKRIEALTKTD
jgi:hypothetical protein